MCICESYEREMPVSYEQELYLANELGFGDSARCLEGAGDLLDEISGRGLLNSSFIVDRAIHMKGALNRSVLCQVMTEIARRHEVFRTTFHRQNGRIVQRIHSPKMVEIPEIDLTGYPDSVIEAVISYECTRVIDLSRTLPLSLLLIRRAKDDHVLCISVHHIVFDGWSQGILAKEFVMLYRAFARGDDTPLMESTVQYADYVLRPRRALQEPRLSALLSYWKSKLDGMGPAPRVEFPDAMDPVAPIYSGRFKNQLGSPVVLKKMKSLATASRTTLFMVFAAAIASWIFRTTGQTDIGLLIPVANRNNVECEDMIGWFANQLVLRLNVLGNSTFTEVLDQVRFNMMEAMAHSDLPFQILDEEFAKEQPASWNPKKSTVFVAMERQSDVQESVHAGALDITGFSYTPVNFVCNRPMISMFFTELPDNYAITLGYPPEWFDDGKVVRLIESFIRLLNDMIDKPLDHLAEMPFEQESVVTAAS